MMKLDLQQFGGRGSSSGGGGTGQNIQSKSKKELPEEIEKRITDSNGNVKEIAPGFRYNIYRGNELFYDKASASEANEWLEGLTYDATTGTFKNENGRTSYKVRIVKKKK